MSDIYGNRCERCGGVAGIGHRCFESPTPPMSLEEFKRLAHGLVNTRSDADKITALERENAELRKSNEILAEGVRSNFEETLKLKLAERDAEIAGLLGKRKPFNEIVISVKRYAEQHAAAKREGAVSMALIAAAESMWGEVQGRVIEGVFVADATDALAIDIENEADRLMQIWEKEQGREG